MIEWERLWDALPTVSLLLWTAAMVVILGSLTQRWRVPAEWARPILLAAAIGAAVESVNYGLDHRWLMLVGAAASVPLFLLAWDMRAPELGRVSRWAALVTRGKHGEDPD